MGTAVGDILRYYRKVTVPKRVAELEYRLVSDEEGSFDFHHSERVAAEIFSRTGLPPSEYKRLDPGGKLVWLEKALVGETGEEEQEAPPDDDSLLEQVLGSHYITPHGAKIFEAIWKAKSRSMRLGKIGTVQRAFNTIPATDAAVMTALKRLKLALGRMNYGIDLEISEAKGRAAIVYRQQN